MNTRDETKVHTEKLDGEVVDVGYRSEETGYSILTVQLAGSAQSVKLVGVSSAAVGEQVSAEGQWKLHPKFGRQFAASAIHVSRPESADAIVRYLAAGNVRGIGPTLATKIVAAFGEDTLRVLDEAPERLAELRGIGKKKLAEIRGHWQETAGARQALLMLAGYGIIGAIAQKVIKRYGLGAGEVVRGQPYRLAAEVHGVGFETADKIALGNGLSREAPARIDAGLRHVVTTAIGVGHCGITLDAFMDAARSLLGVPDGVISPVLATEFKERNYLVKVILPGSAPYVFDKRLYDAECRIADRLAEMRELAPRWGLSQEAALAIARDAEAAVGVELAPEQLAAVVMALRSRIGILTGGPGTGKTSTLKVILHAYRQVRAEVVMGAPTGKAAKRMHETTGFEAATIARLVGWGQGGSEGGLDREIECDVLVIDEASMLDVSLLDRVLRCLTSGASILLVGDVDQLPSVSAGRVLGDMIESGAVPTVRLTQVFRQAASSAIIRNAHRINRGIDIEAPSGACDFYFIPADDPRSIADKVIAMVAKHIPERVGIPSDSVQVLSPMRKSGTGTEVLNRRLQMELNPSPAGIVERFGKRYGVGDRVLQTVNNYELGTMNGESGIIRAVNMETATVQVQVDDATVEYSFGDLSQLDLAYAMTVHKSQGSQFPAVVIPVSTQHYVMLQRAIIYTAITRATKFCVLVGQREALQQAVRNMRVEPRVTTLGIRLERLVASAVEQGIAV